MSSKARWSNDSLSIASGDWSIECIDFEGKGASTYIVVASRSLGGREDPSVAGGVDAGSEPKKPRRGTPITAITHLGSFSVHFGAQLWSFGAFHQILVRKYTFSFRCANMFILAHFVQVDTQTLLYSQLCNGGDSPLEKSFTE